MANIVTVEYKGSIDSALDAALVRAAGIPEVSAGYSFGVRDIDFSAASPRLALQLQKKLVRYARRHGLCVTVVV